MVGRLLDAGDHAAHRLLQFLDGLQHLADLVVTVHHDGLAQIPLGHGLEVPDRARQRGTDGPDVDPAEQAAEYDEKGDEDVPDQRGIRLGCQCGGYQAQAVAGAQHAQPEFDGKVEVIVPDWVHELLLARAAVDLLRLRTLFVVTVHVSGAAGQT